MKFFLISDNVDTMVGMRMAGIEGIVIHNDDEVKSELSKAIEREDVAVILITEHLVSLCPDLVYDLKLNRKKPLIVEIPDRHGNGRTADSISKYVQEAIGVKL
ncbi:MAG: V-type ATP synthase subunit F [Oscillospiraceae bacterium]|nr:V-type ATP synthase subunit F [Oscillospiraceae bacterium]